MGDDREQPGDRPADLHLSIQRVDMPIMARESSVALEALAKLAEEKAKRIAAERKLERLQRSSADLMKSLAKIPGGSLKAGLVDSPEKLRLQRLEIERRSAELAQRAEELTALGVHLSEEFAALEDAREKKFDRSEKADAVRELVQELRQQESLRSEPEPRPPKSAASDDTFAGVDVGSLDEAAIVRLCVDSILKKGESTSYQREAWGDEPRPPTTRPSDPWLSRAAGELQSPSLANMIVTPETRETERASRADLLRVLETARADAAQLASALQWIRAEHESEKRAAEESKGRRRDAEQTLALVRSNLRRITTILRAKGNAVEALRQEMVAQRQRWEEGDVRLKELVAQDLALRQELEASRPARSALEKQVSDQTRQLAELNTEMGHTQKKLWSQELATNNAEAALEATRAQLGAAVTARLKLDGEAGRLEEKLRKLELKLDSTERNRGRAVEALAVLEADLRQVGERASAAEAAQREAVAKAGKKQAELTRVRRSLRLAREGRERDQAQLGQLELRIARMKVPAGARDAEEGSSLAVATEIRRLADSLGRANEITIRAIQERLDREAYERLALELSVRSVTQRLNTPQNPASREAAATAVAWSRTRQTLSALGWSLHRGTDGALRVVQTALPKAKPAVVASFRRIREQGARLRGKL